MKEAVEGKFVAADFLFQIYHRRKIIVYQSGIGLLAIVVVAIARAWTVLI